MQIMSHLVRFLFVIVCMSFCLGTPLDVLAAAPCDNDLQQTETQVRQSDGRSNRVAEQPVSAVEAFLRSAQRSRRVVSARPTRLLPTCGGKNSGHASAWGRCPMSDPLLQYASRSCLLLGRNGASAASQRLYYVIALRCLLC